MTAALVKSAPSNAASRISSSFGTGNPVHPRPRAAVFTAIPPRAAPLRPRSWVHLRHIAVHIGYRPKRSPLSCCNPVRAVNGFTSPSFIFKERFLSILLEWRTAIGTIHSRLPVCVAVARAVSPLNMGLSPTILRSDISQ